MGDRERREKGKKGVGVMIMIKSTINVINAEYGEGKIEFITTQIMSKCGETQNTVVAYILSII